MHSDKVYSKVYGQGNSNYTWALSTWKQICYSSNQSLVVNGRVVYIYNLDHASLTTVGNITLKFGLVYGSIPEMKITQVNVFFPCHLSQAHAKYNWQSEEQSMWGIWQCFGLELQCIQKWALSMVGKSEVVTPILYCQWILLIIV